MLFEKPGSRSPPPFGRQRRPAEEATKKTHSSRFKPPVMPCGQGDACSTSCPTCDKRSATTRFQRPRVVMAAVQPLLEASLPPPFRQPAWVRGKEWAKNWNRHPDFGPTVGCSPEHPCSQPRFSRSRFRSLLNLTAAFPHNARLAARLWTMYHSARGWHKKKDGLDPGSDCSRGHSDGVLPRQDLRVWHGPSGRVSVPDLPISARWRQLTVGFPLCPCGNPMRQPLASGAGPW